MGVPQPASPPGPPQKSRANPLTWPWYVWPVVIVAFFGGLLTVAICILVAFFICIGAAAQWFEHQSPRGCPKCRQTCCCCR